MDYIVLSQFYYRRKMYRRGEIVSIPEFAAKGLVNSGLLAENIAAVSDGKPIVIVCIASGASLTVKDCSLVKKWRFEDQDREERRVIAVNNSYQRAVWADYLFAIDADWWRHYQPEFDGEKITVRDTAGLTNANLPADLINKNPNSGAIAMLYAKRLGARRIILLGYDLKTGRFGKKHWHTDHPEPLGNAGTIADWPKKFEAHYNEFRNIDVINCTRDTALDIYPKVALEDELSC